MTILLVAAGGALGAVARYCTYTLASRFLGIAFPFGTLIVNVIGSFAMGVVMAWFMKKAAFSEEMRLFLATGFLGAYTTFSTFSLDVWQLYEKGAYGSLLLYLSGSIFCSIAGLVLGLILMQRYLDTL